MNISKLPVNTFKQALLEGRSQIGLWLGLADPYAAELLAHYRFRLVVDRCRTCAQ